MEKSSAELRFDIWYYNRKAKSAEKVIERLLKKLSSADLISEFDLKKLNKAREIYNNINTKIVQLNRELGDTKVKESKKNKTSSSEIKKD